MGLLSPIQTNVTQTSNIQSAIELSFNPTIADIIGGGIVGGPTNTVPFSQTQTPRTTVTPTNTDTTSIPVSVALPGSVGGNASSAIGSNVPGASPLSGLYDSGVFGGQVPTGPYGVGTLQQGLTTAGLGSGLGTTGGVIGGALSSTTLLLLGGLVLLLVMSSGGHKRK